MSAAAVDARRVRPEELLMEPAPPLKVTSEPMMVMALPPASRVLPRVTAPPVAAVSAVIDTAPLAASAPLTVRASAEVSVSAADVMPFCTVIVAPSVVDTSETAPVVLMAAPLA